MESDVQDTAIPSNSIIICGAALNRAAELVDEDMDVFWVDERNYQYAWTIPNMSAGEYLQYTVNVTKDDTRQYSYK